MTAPAIFHDRRAQALLFVFVCLGCAYHVLLASWVAEDAFISFRVVDNFLAGHGLRWNIDERVQVFTHPLWLLLHIPIQAVSGNLFLGTIGLSIACALAGAWLLCRMVPGSFLAMALVLLLLPCSMTLRQFLISGLENPLTFLLLAWFMRELFRPPEMFRLTRLYVAAALALCTRFDNLIVLLPPLLWATWTYRSQFRLSRAVAAASPLLAWLAFSLLYYGFFLPNTKYAKLPDAAGMSVYLRHAWHYYKVSFLYDMVGAFLLCFALCIGIRHIRALIDGVADRRRARIAVVAFGLIAHLLYLIYIGGDFMAGRFFFNALVTALVILYAHYHDAPWRRQALVLLVFCFVWGAAKIVTPIVYPNPNNFFRYYGITSERAFYGRTHGLFRSRWMIRTRPDFGRAPNADRFALVGDNLVRTGNIGAIGYRFGPRKIILDKFGIGDPFLVRAAPVLGRWRPGHFVYKLPKGYIRARQTGDTSYMAPPLADFYRKLRLVTAGDLFDPERLKTILEFQLGTYDNIRQSTPGRKKP